MGNGRFKIELFDSHIHLSKQAFRTLFGENAKLQIKQSLSQPGLFMAVQTVEVAGPQGKTISLPVCGPLRAKTQIEVSMQEAALLGIEAKREADGPEGGTATLRTPLGSLQAEGCVVIPAARLYMPPEDASPYNLRNMQQISLKVCGRPDMALEKVIVQVSHTYVTRLYLLRQQAAEYGIADGDECEL